jgi:energy-coupling factor transporter ATP-binding protein EcfA2
MHHWTPDMTSPRHSADQRVEAGRVDAEINDKIDEVQSETPGPEILGLSSVSFSFDDDKPLILKDVSLSIRRGERILLLGPSGGGKSTLLMVLAGLIPRIIDGALSGEVRLNGVDTNKIPTSLASFSRSAAIVMQDPESQITCLTVEDEVAFGLENFNTPKAETIERVDRTLRGTKMDHMREALVYTLSGGQKQRLAIACALARSPDVIILDEPLSNLDPVGSAEVMPLIENVVSLGEASLIMTAHDYAAFAHQFSRIVIVADGRIVRDGPIREVLADVPLLNQFGLEIPPYVAWARQQLGSAMTQAPLTANEAVEQVATAGKIARHRPRAEPTLPSVDAEVVIRVKDLSLTFRKNPVLKNLDFSIRRGEIVALVGYNGSGKSTLALAVAGVIPPTRGTIEVLGETYRFRRGRKIGTVAHGIGYVFQYPEHQFLHESALEEVMHDLEESDRPYATSLLSAIGITDGEIHPYELSGGEKRRLGVKAAIARPPQILIMDEPTYGQDARNRQLIEDDIRTLNARGTTIIVITHDMDFVHTIASRALVLRHGELAFDGAVAELFAPGADLKSFGLISPATEDLRRAIAARITTEGERHVG